MCSLQLHRLVHDASLHQIHLQPQCRVQGYQTQVSAIHPQKSRSMYMKQIGRCIPVLKSKQRAQSKGAFCFVYASATRLPSKEAVNAVKTLTANSIASVLKVIHESQLLQQCAPAIGLMAFATWGLVPILRLIHRTVLRKEDRSWKESQLNHIMRMYVRPVLLWIGVILVCRAFDPVVLSTETSQAIKQRFLNFVRSLSTVLAFAYCTNSAIQQMHKIMLDRQDAQDSRSLGAQFVGNAVYTAVWIAAICLFMELLGFSTQKMLTAGGLGTVLLTLAGREIFTNFLSSIMIHATRPFVLNEWIQTKIDGYEVSGTVEHVGWWSPTIVRGDDREAVHIPNHKFTVSVVRNLTQKSHWRIKTYFGISHLDVSKISNIVADMRKVLAKHPQVEQRRLHRRVFFESVAPENQALMVLVSCFVKTPHFEEYLRVKEVILLDLMKVISHHHARLATPIRSMQRVLDDIEPRAAPFRDTNRSAESQGKPYLLIEATAVANAYRDADQITNSKNGASQARDEMINSSDGASGNDQTSGENTNLKKEVKGVTATNDESHKNNNSSDASDSKVVSKQKSQLEGLDSMGLNSKDITLLGAAFEKPPVKIPEDPVDSQMHSGGGDKVKPLDVVSMKSEKSSSKMLEQISQPVGGTKAQKPHARVIESPLEQKSERLSKSNADLEEDSWSLGEEESNTREEINETHTKADVVGQKIDTKNASSSKGDIDRGIGSGMTKSQLEENLVLGVALNGPKQTLPIDNEISSISEQKELVGSGNGSLSSVGKDGLHVIKDGRSASQSSNIGPSESR